MIRVAQGDLLRAPVEALVNTVNEIGVMGKGLALTFREKFPSAADEYIQAAKRGEIKVGHVFVSPTNAVAGLKFIIHFPTKKHWRHPSKLAWIQEGLKDLRLVIEELDIRSIALPPLGCGNGGLHWSDVRPHIERELASLADVDVWLYEPTSAHPNPAKRKGVTELTPARGLIVEMIRRYSILGLDCTNLEVQKLAWFLSETIKRMGLSDPLKLSYVAHKYGPYADRLRFLLDSLDGSYISSQKRIVEASPFDRIQFNESHRSEIESYLDSAEMRPYRGALESTAITIDGFESPLGMELLGTIDWLLTRESVQPNLTGIKAGLSTWAGGGAAAARKMGLFNDRLIGVALERLAYVHSGKGVSEAV